MIHRTLSSGLALVLAVGLVACGQGEPDENLDEGPDSVAPAPTTPAPTPPAGGAAGAAPSWMHVNGNQISMDIAATGAAGTWGFNGARNGAMTITVPTGAAVTINFRNDDQTMVHSIGVAPFAATPPANPPAQPVFQGAISPNATSATDATKPGQTAVVTFTADKAGEYSLLCFVPGHATAGMWVRFNVADGATPGVTGATAQ
jgi:plastocyanin